MTFRRRSDTSSGDGFTLLELMTVMVIMAILFLLAVPAFSYLRGKAERAKCVSNLHSLYAAGSAYVHDTNSWPQVDTRDLQDPAYAQGWIDAFSGYKIGRINWICATVQRQTGNPPYEDSDHARVDYIPTPFDDSPHSPLRWPNHPWFIECGDVHGDGNLIIFASGQVKSLNEAKKDAKGLPSSN